MRAVVLPALHAVGAVVAQSMISGAVALATAVVYARGCFWTGRAPAQQSRTEFLVTNMAALSGFFVLALALAFSTPLARHRCAMRPETPVSHLFWFKRLVRTTWVPIVASIAAIVGLSIASTQLGDAWAPYRLHFYTGALCVQYVVAVLDVAARMLYRTETVDGHATTTRKRTTTVVPTWKRIARTYVRDLGYLASVYAASVYIDVANRVPLETQEMFVAFSLGSMALRSVVMKIMLWVVRRKHTVSLRLLYVLTAVPTVMIGTQVRIALLRVTGSVSTTSVVVLALVEPLLRVAKVWRVRRDVDHIDKARVAPTRSATATAVAPLPLGHAARSQLHVRDIGHVIRSRSARTRAASRLDRSAPTQLLLQFTAAEIHADMCAEYIAVACSLAIFYCLEGHPRFAWPVTTRDLSSTSEGWRRVELVVLQLVVELLVDTGCCAWELVHGIPLHTSKALGRFLLGVFTGCSVANVGVCCLLYIR